ncbi:MAG: hypothetical protein IJU52_04330 [Clostridia bacterium]|nr:hypothetical protein [Clostridia bacterium]
MNAETKSMLKNKKFVGSFIMLCLLFALLLISLFIVFNSSLGWFAVSGSASVTDMQIIVNRFDYELLVDRIASTTAFDNPGAPVAGANPSVGDGEFDRIDSNSDPVYPGVSPFKSTLAASPYSYSFAEWSTNDASKLAFELVNETQTTIDSVHYRYLMPGAHGTLTFYLRDRTGSTVADLALTTNSFYYTMIPDPEDSSQEIPHVEEVINDTVNALLRGHMLFFKSRTGSGTVADPYVYGGLVDNELLQIDSGVLLDDDGNITLPTVTKNLKGEDVTCYQITLYWEWPLTYGEINDNIGVAASQTKRYPASLRTYMDDHRDFFFLTNQNSSDPELLSDGYNDGDQLIGENANFLVAFISPL